MPIKEAGFRPTARRQAPSPAARPTPGRGATRAEPPALPDLRVALVHDWLTGMRGGERCLEIFCDIFPNADLHTLLHVPGSVSARIERLPVRASPLGRVPGIGRCYRHWLPLFPWAIEQFELHGYDLVLSSSHCVAKGVPTGDIPHLSYCHTPMRYVWDRFDDYFGPDRGRALRLAARLFRRPLQQWDKASSARVGRFIANSAHVARRIRRYYGRLAEVIHPPVEIERFSISPEVGDYYLIVSALAPYKRIDTAIEAFRRLGRLLLIVGTGPEETNLRRLAGDGNNVRFLGWRPDEEVAGLLARCRAFILAGEEDFGIAPLEAMASGRPVLAPARGGARETVVDIRRAAGAEPTGVLYERPGAESLAEAVELLESRMDELSPHALREHASRFSVPRFRREIVSAIASFLESPRREREEGRGGATAG